MTEYDSRFYFNTKALGARQVASRLFRDDNRSYWQNDRGVAAEARGDMSLWSFWSILSQFACSVRARSVGSGLIFDLVIEQGL